MRFGTSGEVFATRCRGHAELLRKIAKTARTGELRESLLRLAQDFDQMAERAIQPMSMSLPERSKKTAN